MAKLIFFTIFILTSTVTSDTETDLTYIKICNETSPITLAVMNDILINKRLSANGGATSAFKCFLYCLYLNYRWMDEDGGFYLHVMRETLEESDVDVASLDFVLYKCTALSSVDKCERALLFTECFWNRMKENDDDDEKLFFNIEDVLQKK
nr:odorant-binding protein [Lasioderma serricorne]